MASEVGREVCREDVLGVSVGAAFCPRDGDDPEQLIAEADRRMYAAKSRRKAVKLAEERLELAAHAAAAGRE